MKKILVTTDFSTHSKAGLRFAIQLAALTDVELIFFHCYQALIPTTIHRERINNAMREQTEAHLQQLKNYVENLYKSMKVAPKAYRWVIMEDLSPENAILGCAARNACDYICISTRGGGTLKKIIGTNASNIITRSSVPVIVVPYTYRVHTIKKILYASDLENINSEMSKVVRFAQSLAVKVDLAHFYYPANISLDWESLMAKWWKKHKCLDRIFLQQLQLDEDVVGQLNHLTKKVKPSIIIFFTQTNQTWFDKLFRSSRSEGHSFVTKTPMLVLRKTG